MKSRIDSPLPGRLTRRTATVTISAPDSSCAWRMMSLLGYLPVPTMSRDVKSLPPSTRFVSYMLPAPHWPNDFHAVSLAQRHRGVRRLRRDLAVDRHRRELALHREVIEERTDAEPVGDLHLASVDGDLHQNENGRSLLSRVRPRLFTPCSLRRHYPEQVRGVPGRTRFSGILPPRRQGEVYQRARQESCAVDLPRGGCYLVRHGSRRASHHGLARSVPMKRTTRRQFLQTSSAATAG